jgi:tRNA dimethylallyltransferase
VISGPTASGKSLLAVEIAQKFNGVIVNADSCQIYKKLPILSAQPGKEEFKRAEHRLYSILEPIENNSVFRWLNLVENESKEIFASGKNMVVVGGTGMYISRLVDGIVNLLDVSTDIREELNVLYDKIGWECFYEKVSKIDPEASSRLNKNDRHRLIRIYEIYLSCGKKMSELEKNGNKKLFEDECFFHINLFPDRIFLYSLCEKRFLKMLENNTAIDETRSFLKENKDILDSGRHYSIYNTLGFMEIRNYLENKISKEEMIFLTVKKTKNYAKRQYTWFKNQFKNIDFLVEDVVNVDNGKKILQQIVNKVGKTDEKL